MKIKDLVGQVGEYFKTQNGSDSTGSAQKILSSKANNLSEIIEQSISSKDLLDSTKKILNNIKINNQPIESYSNFPISSNEEKINEVLKNYMSQGPINHSNLYKNSTHFYRGSSFNSQFDKYASNESKFQINDILNIVSHIEELRKHPEIQKKIIREIKTQITVDCFEKFNDLDRKKVLDFLVDVKEFEQFCKFLKAPQEKLKVKSGPLVKNQASFDLEFILNMYLHQEKSVTHQSHPINTVVVEENFHCQTFKLDEIVKHANFEHVNLDEFSQYKYLEKNGYLNLLESFTLQGFLKKAGAMQMSSSECVAVYQYTSSQYKLWNNILRGDLKDANLKEIAGIVIAISGLKKLRASSGDDADAIVRFEKATQDNIDLYKNFQADVLERKQSYQQNRLYPGKAFSSFSTDPTLLDTFRNVSPPCFAGVTLMLGAAYQSIADYSEFQEAEVLLPPGQFQIKFFTSIKTNENDEYFYSIVHFMQSLTGLTVEQRRLGKEIKPMLHSFKGTYWTIYNQKKMLDEFLNEPIGNFLKDSDISQAITYVKKILHTPYTDLNDLHVHSSWVLKTPLGDLYRPNHGLSHTLTVAFFVPWIVYVLKNFADDAMPYQNFKQRHIKILQLCMLFSVVGRKNDIGWAENKSLYKSFRQQSGELFEKYCLQHCMHLFENADEVSIYKKHLIDMGNLDNHDPIHVIINMSHKLHLLRCFDKSDLGNSIIAYFKSEMVGEASEIINALVLLSALCIRLTGDKIPFLGCSYSEKIFYQNNCDEFECWEKLSLATRFIVDIISCAIVNSNIKSLENVTDTDLHESFKSISLEAANYNTKNLIGSFFGLSQPSDDSIGLHIKSIIDHKLNSQSDAINNNFQLQECPDPKGYTKFTK